VFSLIKSCYIYSHASSSSSLTQHHRKRQNTQKNNKNKTKRREGTYLQAPTLPSHFWLSFLPFCFERSLLTSSSSQLEEKKKKQRKKNHREEKEGVFLQAFALFSHFLLLLLPFHFYPSISNAFSWHLFFLK
jgi:hypothetical protein